MTKAERERMDNLIKKLIEYPEEQIFLMLIKERYMKAYGQDPKEDLEDNDSNIKFLVIGVIIGFFIGFMSFALTLTNIN